MEIKELHRGAFAAVSIRLDVGERIKVEPGAMVAMDSNVKVETKSGGILKGLKRAFFGGESFFFNYYEGPGEIVLAPLLIGDIIVLDLNGEMLVQSTSFLAASDNVEVDTKFGGFKSFFMGEGIFLIRLSGNGKVVLGSFGGIMEKKLLPGEEYIVDTGHVVAFDSTITYDVKAFGGIKSFFFGGEGLIVRMKGPGRIFYQTRNYPAFLQWIKTTSKTTGSR